MRLADLPTPCLVLDRARLRRNLEHASLAAQRLGVAWRVDMQAARCIEAARLAFSAARAADARMSGIAVSTLAEAEYFAAHDLTDILYAVGITPDKLEQVAKLNAAHAAVLVVTADAEAATAIADHPAAASALIAIDGGNGFGLSPDDPALLVLAGRLGTRFAGLLLHGATDTAGIAQAVARLQQQGSRARLVSAASGTVAAARDVPAITELCEGAGMLDTALTVLASITGRRAGWLSLDVGAVALGGGGRLHDPTMDARFGGAPVQADWPEQAMVRIDMAASLPALGERLRVTPHDPALAAAAHDHYFVVDGGEDVLAIWPRVGGW